MMHGRVAEARAVLATLVGPEEADETIAAWGKPEKEEARGQARREQPVSAESRDNGIAAFSICVVLAPSICVD